VNVETVLELAADALRDAGGAFTTNALQDKMTREFMESLGRIDALLSLDRRFARDTHGAWQLSTGHAGGSGAAHLVEQALLLRDRALDALQAERQAAEARLSEIQDQLKGIDANLLRLGHRPDVDVAAPPPPEAQEYSLEYHLGPLPAEMRHLALKVHQAIMGLPDTHAVFNKYHIAYSTHQRFAMLIPHKSKLDILIKADAGLQDPEGWTRDATGRRLGLERIFSLDNMKDIDRAIPLVQQSYKLVNKRSGK